MSVKLLVPTREELCEFIRYESAIKFPDEPTLGIKRSVYRSKRPLHWVWDAGLLKDFGYDPSPDGWDKLVNDFTGLTATREDYRIIPEREELVDFIIEQSKINHPRRDDWAISMRHYDGNKPYRWDESRNVLSAYGYRKKVREWSSMMYDLTGRIVPDVNEINRFYGEERANKRESDAMRRHVAEASELGHQLFYDEHTGIVFNREELPNDTHWNLSTMSVLHGKQSDKPVTTYNPYRYRYEEVPAECIVMVM